MTSRAAATLTWSVLLLVLAGAVSLIILPKLTGSVPLTVLTGSMQPTYAAGSVVIVRPTPTADLRIGDAITYQARSGDPTVVTHRIVAISTAADGERTFTTQGDANDAPDQRPVTEAQVRGRVWYGVPYVGYVSTWLTGSNREVVTNVLAAGLLLYGAVTVAAGLRDKKRNAVPSRPGRRQRDRDTVSVRRGRARSTTADGR